MLDIQFIRDNKEIVQAAMKNKNREDAADLDQLLKLADERKRLAGEISDINRKRNAAQNARDIESGKRLKNELQSAEEKSSAVEKELVGLLLKIPNVPSPDTPIGIDESANVVAKQWGEKKQFSFTPKPHWDLGRDLGIIDSEKAAEVSGARFTYLKGDLVSMHYALVNLVFKILTSREELEKIAKAANLEIDPKPFVPVMPPLMMRSSVMNRMARLDPIDDRFYFEKDDLVFIGSAEHTLGPLHLDETILEQKLPLRYVGYTTAFRREAGAAGRDTRGILRQHQFEKVEMETFTKPEDGLREQDFLVAIQEHLMQLLKLPYQVMLISSGDMGFPDQRQIDIETWMPGQENEDGTFGKYRETHSADYVGGFQARRLKTRIKRENGETEPVHMNDATALAGRTLIAIMENYQNEDGTISIPEVLQDAMGKDVIKKLEA